MTQAENLKTWPIEEGLNTSLVHPPLSVVPGSSGKVK